MIYFCDESSIRSDYHTGATLAPIGDTPVMEATGPRSSAMRRGVVSTPRPESRRTRPQKARSRRNSDTCGT